MRCLEAVLRAEQAHGTDCIINCAFDKCVGSKWQGPLVYSRAHSLHSLVLEATVQQMPDTMLSTLFERLAIGWTSIGMIMQHA